MNLLPCRLEGLRLIELKIYRDGRGWFRETWSEQRYVSAGLTDAFMQDNVSYSGGGTLRGLHFQNPNAQGKLVTVLRGEVLDVVVDIRRSSPTFREWEMFTLSADNGRQLFIPPGFAHGFFVVSEDTMLQYKCSGFYAEKDAITIRWDDPDLAIAWPSQMPMTSAKDATAPLLRDVDPERLFP